MRREFANKWAGRLRGGLMVLAAWALTGCASMLSANVTTFQQWPADVEGQTYRISTPAPAGQTLEHHTYADMVRAAIGRTGLVEAQAGVDPRFLVAFEYGDPQRTVVVERTYDPYFDGPFFPWGMYGGGFRGGWGWGGMFYSTPAIVNVPVEIHDNYLTVTIEDTRSNTQVFKTTARSGSRSAQLPAVMPYLVRAVFDGFPGNNGQVREVKYELP